ncbi:1-acyl-sn-glycerol-3-phosphate acyltransferase [bacterium]|nr:1-acyl-sn-glycerol-3-phosphate acyltransferase [bacterium]
MSKIVTVLRSFFLAFGGIVFTVIMMLIVIPVGSFSPFGKIMYRLEHFWGRTLIRMAGIKTRVSGLESLRSDRTYIFICNHQSMVDIPLLMAFAPRQLRMIHKKELSWVPLLGFVLWVLKFIPIDRGHREKAIQSLERAVKRIHDGINVVIFADGTRSLDGELKPFKKGAFVLAISAQVDVIPVTISGTINVMHKYRSLFDVRFNREVELIFDPPISTENMTLSQKDELKELVESRIVSNYERVKHLSKIDDEQLLKKIRLSGNSTSSISSVKVAQ